ncbi:MAG: ammonium transporter [Candidatus Adiutrix sp.]|nr:ammonium transporter [Candidatus Adiutrix sp.]
MNGSDTAFMLIATALAFMMTPGMAFFYCGLGRRKNAVNNLMAVVFSMGAVVALWIAAGYSLTYSGNAFGVIGSLRDAGLAGIALTDVSPYAENLPALVFVAFQMMFALITPAILSGAVAGRMKFRAWCVFVVFWSLIVYYPLAHMIWGAGGILGATGLGAVDFAGGSVVHVNAGVSGLVLCIMLGRRNGYERLSHRAHNVPFVALGMALLWFGWFGFNTGSALAANALTSHVVMTTFASAASGLLAWMLIDACREDRPTLIGSCTGAIVGLVAITPCAGFVPVWAALVIGFVGGILSYYTVVLIKERLRIDDALDVFGCHGAGGIWGSLAAGIFASPEISGGLCTGLVYGGTRQLWVQLVVTGIAILFAASGTIICVSIARSFTQLRVGKRDELAGLDAAQHGEMAYPSFTGLDR